MHVKKQRKPTAKPITIYSAAEEVEGGSKEKKRQRQNTE